MEERLETCSLELGPDGIAKNTSEHVRRGGERSAQRRVLARSAWFHVDLVTFAKWIAVANRRERGTRALPRNGPGPLHSSIPGKPHLGELF